MQRWQWPIYNDNLKALSVQVWIRYICFFKLFIFIWIWYRFHPRQTRVRDIRFLLFQINRVLVYIYIIKQSFNLRICLFYTFSFKMYIPTKKHSRKKAKKLCLMCQIVTESHSCLEYRQNRKIHKPRWL